MNKHQAKNISIGIAMTLCALLIVGITNTLATRRIQSSTQACTGSQPQYTATIKDNTVTPAHLSAPRCAHLTIINLDSTHRLIAFGEHEHHTPYDGVTEKQLEQNQSLTVTLNQTGSYMFHDHLHDEVQGTFTVTPRN